MKYLIHILVLFCFGISFGQIEIESDTDDDYEIGIDTNQSINVGRSLPLALLLSAAVPGAGEFYLKDKTAGKIFVLMEVGFWGGVIFSYLARESYLQSAKNAAAQYAGVSASDIDEDFLAKMTQYRAYRERHHRKDSYEHAQILSGERNQEYDLPTGAEYDWDFGSALIQDNTDNWNRFINSTKSYGRAKVAMTWAFGGVLLGRVVSLLHTLHVYRRTAVKGFSEAEPEKEKRVVTNWELIPQPSFDGIGLSLKVGF